MFFVPQFLLIIKGNFDVVKTTNLPRRMEELQRKKQTVNQTIHIALSASYFSQKKCWYHYLVSSSLAFIMTTLCGFKKGQAFCKVLNTKETTCCTLLNVS